jgi:hypothetical protein
MVICCEPDVFAKSDPPPGTRAAMAARLCARDSATVGPEEVEGTEDAISSKVRRNRRTVRLITCVLNRQTYLAALDVRVQTLV